MSLFMKEGTAIVDMDDTCQTPDGAQAGADHFGYGQKIESEIAQLIDVARESGGVSDSFGIKGTIVSEIG